MLLNDTLLHPKIYWSILKIDLLFLTQFCFLQKYLSKGVSIKVLKISKFLQQICKKWEFIYNDNNLSRIIIFSILYIIILKIICALLLINSFINNNCRCFWIPLFHITWSNVNDTYFSLYILRIIFLFNYIFFTKSKLQFNDYLNE